ncbi:MAG: DUF4252 domain-containing protein [Acidobacteria bacterium]|nr:DUF4252 domain-containing protein [Acidobacteriota bacterium]
MKILVSAVYKFVFVFSFVAACALAPSAQTINTPGGGRVQLGSLDRLAPKAVETVNVEVDEILLGIATPLLQSDDPEEKDIKEVVAGLKGVYVRVLGFKSEGEYAEADLAPIREQLSAPGWTRIVGIQSRKAGLENAEVYVSRTTAGRVDGLVFIAVEPKKVVVVNLVGSIDLDKLRKLEGNLGIPKVNIGNVKIKTGKRSVAITTKKP